MNPLVVDKQIENFVKAPTIPFSKPPVLSSPTARSVN